MHSTRFSGSGEGESAQPPVVRPPAGVNPHREQTDRCKNITLLQTLIAGSNYVGIYFLLTLNIQFNHLLPD